MTVSHLMGFCKMPELRARSDRAKQRRRHEILSAAEQLLRADGFDALTMNRLAIECGLAKGTLYLYFATREELLLNLYTDLNTAWMDRFLALERTCGAADYHEVCSRFYQSFALDNLLVDLAARSATMLEPHVPQTAWIAAKQAQSKVARRLGGMFCQKFGCEPALAQRQAWAFLVALSGAQQRVIYADEAADIPEDLDKLRGVMSCREMFLNIVLPLAPDTDARMWPFGNIQNDE